MRGKLEAAPLLELFSALRRFRKSGSLICQSASMSLTVSVDHGLIRSVSTSDSSLRIGQVLIQLGFTTEEEIEQALALQSVAPDPERIGEVLVDVGFISESAIGQAMAAQIASALLVMFNDPGPMMSFTQRDLVFSQERLDPPGSDPLILITAFLSEFWLELASVADPDWFSSEDDGGEQSSAASSLQLRLTQVQSAINAGPGEPHPDQPRVVKSLAFLLRDLEEAERHSQSGDERPRSGGDSGRTLELVDRQIDIWDLTDLTRGGRAALLSMLNGERRYQQISVAVRIVDALPGRAIAELFEQGIIQHAESKTGSRSSDSGDEDRMNVMRFLR